MHRITRAFSPLRTAIYLKRLVLIAVITSSMLFLAPGYSVSPAGEPFSVLLAAGDIAKCDSSGDESTARLLSKMNGVIATLGDNVYQDGRYWEFQRCFGPSWGKFKSRIKPAPGNHEYRSGHAVGYFRYFGEAAGEKHRGYYSYNLGGWHIISLNSECAEIGGCGEGSPQMEWLIDDLERNPSRCSIAYWHHPLFSYDYGEGAAMRPVWKVLSQYGVEIVLVGHDHNYQRFAPQDENGNLNLKKGIRQFTVGTGGATRFSIAKRKDRLPNLEVLNDRTYGLLRLNLFKESYSWQFVPVEGAEFTDSGGQACH